MADCPASYFRQRTRLALTGKLPVAAMMIFLVILPTLLADILVTIASLFVHTTSPLILSWCLYILALLVTPCLSLGLQASLLTMFRGGKCTWKDVFCRRGCFLQAIGLYLLMGLKIFLWTLPGLATQAILVSLAFYFESALLQQYLTPVGVAIGVVLCYRATLHYALSAYILADRPQLKIRACIRESISIMRLRKMRLFLLELSFIGWCLLALAVIMFFDALSPILSLVVSMIAFLAIYLYRFTSIAAFYDEYKDKPCPDVKPRGAARP